MFSAAVIGRQLRQQNTITRTSGPLVPPVYKGRPRTPSVFGRPYSPVATSSTQGTGAGAGVTSEPISNTYSSSAKPQLSVQSKARSEPLSPAEDARLRCTWKCFCITLKALSFGIILLATGAALFVIGFIAENDYIHSQGIRPDQFNADQRSKLMMLRNLTYAGPVVMGLGAVVVVAGLVLAFEERDTLGVKTVPRAATVSASKTPVPVVIAGLPDSGPGDRKSTIASVSSTFASGLTGGFASTRRPGSDMNLTTAHLTAGGVKEGMFDRSRLQETIQETALSVAESMAQAASGAGSWDADQRRSQVSAKRPVTRDDCCIFTTSSSSGTSSHHRLSNSIEQACFGFESPQDPAISDPEACSLHFADRRRSARCSCTASPTLSAFDLFPDDPADDTLKDQLLEQQRLQHRLLQQQQLLIQQQQQQLQVQQRLLQEQKQKSQSRRSATAVAFIESDSLSTASSSDEHLFSLHSSYKVAAAQPYHKPARGKSRTCYAAVHRDYDDGGGRDEAAVPLLHPNDAIRRSISSSSSHHEDLQRSHDKRFPLLRPPEVL